jgi:hypothetical protein
VPSKKSHPDSNGKTPEILSVNYTDKRENQNFLIYKEFQNGAVAKSYMTIGLLIYG